MGVFKQGKPVNTEIVIPGQYRGKHYLNCGMHRVYTTGWSQQWLVWQQEHGSIGKHGEALTSYRYREGGRHRRIYVDMSLADIDISSVDIQPFDPVNTKYMNQYGVNGVSLKDIAHMSTSSFEKFLVNLPTKRTNREKRK